MRKLEQSIPTETFKSLVSSFFSISFFQQNIYFFQHFELESSPKPIPLRCFIEYTCYVRVVYYYSVYQRFRLKPVKKQQANYFVVTFVVSNIFSFQTNFFKVLYRIHHKSGLLQCISEI